MIDIMEIWKPVVGYESLFLISNHGNVKSLRTNKLLKLHTNKRGAKTFCTKIGGRKGQYVAFSVHRLVAESFIPNPDNKPEVNHIDTNPSNNHVDNLEWVTRVENIDHFIKSDKFSNMDFARPEQRVLNYETLLDEFDSSGLSIRKFSESIGCNYGTVQRAIKFLRCGVRYRYK